MLEIFYEFHHNWGHDIDNCDEFHHDVKTLLILKHCKDEKGWIIEENWYDDFLNPFNRKN
jgi:hypothetical protein